MLQSRNKFLFVALLILVVFIQTDSVFAKKSKKKSKKKLVISEAFYDKVWQDFQIGDKKDKNAAIKKLKLAIKKYPREYMSYYYLGIMYAEIKEPNKALKYFKTAVQAFPKSADINFRIGKIFDEKEKYSIAQEYFQKTLALDKTNSGALCKIGIYKYWNEEYDKALEFLTKAKSFQSDNPEVFKYLGLVQIKKKKFVDAIDNITMALKFYPKDAELHLALAKAFDGAGKSADAATEFKKAKKLGRKDDEIKEAIGYSLADSLYKSGDIEKAISEYKKQIRKSDEPGIGYFKLAQAYEDVGDEKKAIKAYIKAYEYDGSLGRGIIKVADLYQREEEWDKAIEAYQMLRRDKEFKDTAKEEIKEIQDLQKQDEKLKLEEKADDAIEGNAEKAYLEILSMDKKNENALEGLRDLYEANGYYKEAMRYVRKLKKLGRYSSYEAKMVLKELREKWKKDNQALYMDNKSWDKSPVDDDQLENMALNGDNNRVREEAYILLLKRKGFKKDQSLIESQKNFYEERGYYKAAMKCVTKLKRYGYLTASEAKEEKARLKELGKANK